MINLKNILLHTIFILFVSCSGTGGCAFFNKIETIPQIEKEDLPNKRNKEELIVEEKAQPQVKDGISQSTISTVDKKPVIKEDTPKQAKEKQVFKKVTKSKKNIPKAKYVQRTDEPEQINPILPSYPKYELDNGIEGIVYIQFRIDTLGNVAESYIGQSSQNDNLDNAALNAVKNSKWKPAKNQGKLVSVWQTLPFEFKLR